MTVNRRRHLLMEGLFLLWGRRVEWKHHWLFDVGHGDCLLRAWLVHGNVRNRTVFPIRRVLGGRICRRLKATMSHRTNARLELRRSSSSGSSNIRNAGSRR